jgi:hypothetical protein
VRQQLVVLHVFVEHDSDDEHDADEHHEHA